VRGGREYERKQREKIRAYNKLENELSKFATVLNEAEQKALKDRSSAVTATAVQAAQAAWLQVQNAITALKRTGLNPTADQQSRIDNLENRLKILEAYVAEKVSPPQPEEKQQPRQRAASAPAMLESSVVPKKPRSPSVLSEEKPEEEEKYPRETIKGIKKDLSLIDTEQKLYIREWTNLGIEKKGVRDFDKQYEARKTLLSRQKDRLLEIKKELLDLEQFSANEKSWSDKFQENKRLLCFNEIDHEIFNISKEIDELKSFFASQKQQKAKEIRAKIELLRLNAANVAVALRALAQQEQALNQIAEHPRKSTLRRPQQVVVVATFTQQSEDNNRAKSFASNIFAVQQPEKKQKHIESFIANVRKLDPERQKAILETVRKINFELALTLEDSLKQTATDVIWELHKISSDRLKYAEAEAKLLLKAIKETNITIESLAGNIDESEQLKNIQGLYTIMLDLQKTMPSNKARLDALVRQWRDSQYIKDTHKAAGKILLSTSRSITQARLKIERLQKQAEGK
jgi:hypothetical protein